MTWDEVLADRCLQDLPYKIELNRWGNIEMSPARNRHGRFQRKSLTSCAYNFHSPLTESAIAPTTSKPEALSLSDRPRAMKIKYRPWTGAKHMKT